MAGPPGSLGSLRGGHACVTTGKGLLHWGSWVSNGQTLSLTFPDASHLCLGNTHGFSPNVPEGTNFWWERK